MPKKLIRKNIIHKLKIGEWEFIEDQAELNELYALKIREELAEIEESNHQDIIEFVDLIQVAFAFAKRNGFTHEQIAKAFIEKSVEKGIFSNIALNNLNPENPSNRLYFSYSLYQLQFELYKMKVGDSFMITGQLNNWDFYDENKDYFSIRNTISNQLILIKKH